ncbi:hypothetical protein S40288_10483 [Stachybotrys chartarum IBT 40288]|nr:hypothetical protein S40288_10483 [Stachybotrys chartarum IBT 40288]
MDGSSSSIEETRRLSQGRISSDYFYQPEKLDDGGGVPPVTLTTTVFCNCVLFLGFSFCDSVFDAEFMGMFLTTFTRMTIETKLEPAGIVEGPRIGNFKFDSPDRDLFPFYDWSDAPIPQQLARSMLRCRCVTLDETVSCYAIDTVRSILFEQGRKDLVCNQDCIVALFWLTIMRVRLAAGLLKKPDQAQLNITLPGIPHIQRHSCVNKNARYWGNSNVTTTAKVGCQTLLHGFPAQCEGNDIILRQSVSANELASAACTIRRTIEQVDHTYVRKLMRLKQCVDRLEDEAAYHRGLKRDTTGVCFEDWSGCEVTRGTGIPHTKGSRAKFHRCDDDVEESKIVLLPCKSKGSWSIWLCLKQDEMERVMAQLAKDKWVKAPGDDSQTKPTLRMDRAAAAPAPR